jgi:hypothetical protein
VSVRSSEKLIWPAILAALFTTVGCQREPQRTAEVVAVPAEKLAVDPADRSWDIAPEHVARLMPQDLVEPRLLEASTIEVKVRAMADASNIAFRIDWMDENKSDTPGPSKFIDACAIQIPERLAKEPPAPQMGEEGKAVQVTYWRADWQASADGRGDTIRDLYPNASIDHYPFEAQSLEKGSPAQKEMAMHYSPARALGNLRSGPRVTPVEDLVALGPGSMKPGPSLGSHGKGAHGGNGWSVVISRKLPEGLVPGQRTQVAFAVWQGSHGEAGARKMRTGWIPLLVRGDR